MPFTIEWDSGVSIGNGSERMIFDPRRNNLTHTREIFITHAHFDHSKGFRFKNCNKISTEETRKIVATYGIKPNGWQCLPIGGKFETNDIEVISHNSGHVLGSAIYEITTHEGNIVYTGDLQIKDSFTLKGAEPIYCDILIMECTFGTESFRFPEREKLAREMVQWAHDTIMNGKIPTFKADALGNAQEITKAFNIYSDLPVIVHQRTAKINRVYTENGEDLAYFVDGSEEASELMNSGKCIYITPKNIKLEEHPEFEPALVSGWAIWNRKYEKAFALSDHADFNQLMEYVAECKPKVVLTCFGGRFNFAFAKKIEKQLGIEARPLDLIPNKFVL
ncbi:MAG: MBL fold metallo-hydrolase [Candidatus Bathyarchaeota archaeon]|jgi:putative mRNA 3-end processing factor